MVSKLSSRPEDYLLPVLSKMDVHQYRDITAILSALCCNNCITMAQSNPGACSQYPVKLGMLCGLISERNPSDFTCSATLSTQTRALCFPIC